MNYIILTTSYSFFFILWNRIDVTLTKMSLYVSNTLSNIHLYGFHWDKRPCLENPLKHI